MSSANSLPKEPGQAPPTPEAVVRGYLDSFVGSEPSEIVSWVSVDFVNEHTAALGSGCRGRDAYLDRLPGFLADMVDLRYEIERLIIAAPTATGPDTASPTDTASLTDTAPVEVAAFYTLTARWQGDHPVRVRGVQRLVVRDGLITHRVDYWDSAVFLGQVDPEAKAFLATRGAAP